MKGERVNYMSPSDHGGKCTTKAMNTLQNMFRQGFLPALNRHCGMWSTSDLGKNTSFTDGTGELHNEAPATTYNYSNQFCLTDQKYPHMPQVARIFHFSHLSTFKVHIKA
jgi:hypothetical protein